MRIALDAMGTDRAPANEIAGAIQALAENPGDLRIVLVGDRIGIEKGLEVELQRTEAPFQDRLDIVEASDRVLPGESPAQSVRRRPDASIVRAFRLQREGQVDAVVSAGPTGAVMAASLILLGSLPGVARPAIGTLLPTSRRPTLMLDAGANVDCKPRHLFQFARLGAIYAQDLMGLERPRVALLSIGEEPGKGSESVVEAHALLRESELDFIGNVEGADIIRGACDVLVCDGFVGNVLLKFYESVAEFTIGLLDREMARAGTTMDLDEVFRVLDYAEYGGAPLLGVNGVSIICHGRSPPKAIRNALRMAEQAVRSRIVEHFAHELAHERDTAMPQGA